MGVFEELLVNALIHRDYLVSAPVRPFIFSDRIELIVPRHLPHNLTVDNIRDGMLFIAKVTRPTALPGSEKSSEKSSEIEWDGTAKRILEIVAADPAASAREVAAKLSLTSRAVEKQFAALKAAGRLRRVGPAKGGRWEVVE